LFHDGQYNSRLEKCISLYNKVSSAGNHGCNMTSAMHAACI